ncbi:MAG TPA: ribonuclease HII [Flavobacteriales bacterium]|jgi:ribonuclease HII|nr:ribonuclease HII [Flavobacteriales bacterium]
MLARSFSGLESEAGCDEAGRGCLAGPVVAAAVIAPNAFDAEGIDDSKKLSRTKRAQLAVRIKEETIWAIGVCSPEEIDKINILKASFLAMERAIRKLDYTPRYLIIDGNRFSTELNIPFHCIVKGDAKYVSIAAASILAKHHRDQLMLKYHTQYPDYQWNTNFGYPTVSHRKGIKQFGITPLHRKTFRLLPDQLALKLNS